MNKIVSLLISSLAVVSFTGCDLSPTENENQSSDVDISGKKVLYIAKAANNVVSATDSIALLKMESWGLKVKTISAAFSTADSTAGFDVIFISESNSASSIGSKYQNITVPIMSCEHYAASDMSWSGGIAFTDFGKIFRQKKIKIVDPTHPATAGLKGVVEVYSQTT